jgi:hypothetical protein
MRQRIFTGALIAAAAGVALLGSAAGQSSPDRGVETMNFDLWCQEQAALPSARCDKRTPEDEKAFEAYQTTLEHYDIPYRSVQYDQGRVNRDIMNTDPIDNPHKDNLGAQRQYPDIPASDAQEKSIPAP